MYDLRIALQALSLLGLGNRIHSSSRCLSELIRIVRSMHKTLDAVQNCSNSNCCRKLYKDAEDARRRAEENDHLNPIESGFSRHK